MVLLKQATQLPSWNVTVFEAEFEALQLLLLRVTKPRLIKTFNGEEGVVVTVSVVVL